MNETDERTRALALVEQAKKHLKACLEMHETAKGDLEKVRKNVRTTGALLEDAKRMAREADELWAKQEPGNA